MINVDFNREAIVDQIDQLEKQKSSLDLQLSNLRYELGKIDATNSIIDTSKNLISGIESVSYPSAVVTTVKNQQESLESAKEDPKGKKRQDWSKLVELLPEQKSSAVTVKSLLARLNEIGIVSSTHGIYTKLSRLERQCLVARTKTGGIQRWYRRPPMKT